MVISVERTEHELGQWLAELATKSDNSVTEAILAAANSLGYAEIRRLQETVFRAFAAKHVHGTEGSACYNMLYYFHF